MFWLIYHKSTKASVAVLKHIQNNCINFRIAHSAVSEGKTEIKNYIVFPLPKEKHQERNVFPQTFKITLVRTFLKPPHASQQ